MVIVELVFGVGPESLDAIDVVVVSVHQRLGVVDPSVFPKLFQGVVTLERVGEED